MVIVEKSSDKISGCTGNLPSTFNHILTAIQDDIACKVIDNGRHTIFGKTQLLIALWYFGTPDSYRSISSRFGVGKATALRAVRRVTKALLKLGPSIITWPSEENLNVVKEGFRQMGFPDTIGAIDGSYIKIPKPKEHGLSYICRKNFPCVILQV